MKKISEIQQFILDKTGIKTSVRKLSGSMKGYYSVRPLFQNGDYPNFPFEICQELKKVLPSNAATPTFCAINYIDIHSSTGIESDVIVMKKEHRAKPISDLPVKTWGSKNSQLRLDKATASNAKRLRAGTTARYY